jgi:hypothetical protein
MEKVVGFGSWFQEHNCWDHLMPLKKKGAFFEVILISKEKRP